MQYIKNNKMLFSALCILLGFSIAGRYNNIKEFDNWLVTKGCVKEKIWINIKTNKTERVTLCTYIRNRVHHPENSSNKIETTVEVKKSIEEMQKIIADYYGDCK